jgi:tRNA threonylcarbamoyladenosine biosynthesis protein TsaB
MKFLIINGTYTTIELAIVNNKTVIVQTAFAHIHASTQLLPAIQEVCKSAGIRLADLTAIGVNVGPGPFTTMRSIIATVNGIAFQSSIPLLSLSGIAAFARGYKKEGYSHSCIVLNAFCRDVYYARYDYASTTLETGSISIELFIEEQKNFLKRYPHARIAYAGNGYTLYQHEFATAFGMHAFTGKDLPEVPSLQNMIDATSHAWENKEATVSQLTPLYFKAYAPHRL